MTKEQIAELDSELYYERLGRTIDWTNLQLWTEKIQWEKIYNEDPLKTLCADKYRVREWVKGRIGEKPVLPFD